MASLAKAEWKDREVGVENSALLPDLNEAEAVLLELASLFGGRIQSSPSESEQPTGDPSTQTPDAHTSSLEAKYRALLEQIPAVVFMVYLDRGISEAYVSPQIEEALGFSREEWLEDPIRWYGHIHPDDKQRWSLEAAGMFLSGKPLRSSYRVIARDGHVIWFHCDAKMMRRPDGQPWFIHGVAFDISDLKHTEEALHQERNVVSAILDTVGALVVVLDPDGRITRFNRACELTTGYSLEEVRGKRIWDFFLVPEEVERFKSIFSQLSADLLPEDYQSYWVTRHGTKRLIAWSSTMLPGNNGTPNYIIATGIDITEREQLEKALLNISSREQRRIGQDLHDGLGQHLTGIAFMAKVHEAKLAEKRLAEANDAAKIVRLVNEAIYKTRELARGLLPVVSDTHGLMSALLLWAAEVEDIFGISCRFECEPAVLIYDDAMATHLYHIAQESVNNALKHGRARKILIRLSAENDRGTLSIRDDGAGIEERRENSQGMGLHIMNYRAAMIGGTLEVAPEPLHGTTVTCIFPLKPGT
ncbi:PAS domain-containing sensor histidine kinase [Tunturiibacter gelidoferens]|uniref:PAS domain S-box-containing protein n=1 Tax=Tunturiibacter gelidiferens TaxID=3069689 RepID=A0ACC5P3B9_9BACT|nr:PAS domain S-box protein [Edaphobacter lichenicola]MBB5341339.1 PAS domain S-box-containing protein [Edaphobacter lichenicola]